MRVLHVLAELKASGAEVMLRAAQPVFASQGVQSQLLSTGESVGAFADELRSAGYEIRHLPFRGSPLFLLRFWRLLRSASVDVVHLHTERANFWIGLVALLGGRHRVVRTVHNAFGFEGRLAARRGWQRRLLSRFGLTHVAISPSVRDNERRRFGLETVLVDNWYDERRFSPLTSERRRAAREALDIGDAQKVILSVGNCSDVKNHASLLEACAKLPPSIDWLYLHIGDEEPGQPERALSERLDIADRVRFLGRRDDPLPYFASSDLYVMPSRYEGFGVAAVEALAMGLPCLFARVPGLSDFEQRFPRIRYASPDAAALAIALEEALIQGFAFDDEAAELTRSHFGTRRGVAGYLAVYRGDLA